MVPSQSIRAYISPTEQRPRMRTIAAACHALLEPCILLFSSIHPPRTTTHTTHRHTQARMHTYGAPGGHRGKEAVRLLNSEVRRCCVPPRYGCSRNAGPWRRSIVLYTICAHAHAHNQNSILQISSAEKKARHEIEEETRARPLARSSITHFLQAPPTRPRPAPHCNDLHFSAALRFHKSHAVRYCRILPFYLRFLSTYIHALCNP